ncbi:MAG: hypothetical protein COV46_07090 [Deltaproteobacteria bacterium CG11_big_fil_rev_8_21_14_0_20_49_13]|nr:MAG: hypothetical protein COV46_07090 [Deltaproteobacteria bacterium CG11_big_fil_rev_8_21_14_0_20_49_13]
MLIAIIALGVILVDSHTLKTRGRGFLAIISFAAATVAVWVAYDYTLQYLTFSSVIVGVLMFTGMLGVIIVIFTESHEWAEALWVRERRRPFVPARLLDEELPMVSIHVPTYNEPPEMVIETLNALADLDYPRFEVIVMDNNTKDEVVWIPVLIHAEKLGPRFRFFHEDKLSGFKSGALNYALLKTSKDASVIGVIDSDYNVDRNWLKDLVPQFMNKRTAIVQAPQDYRDEDESIFKAMCYSEYRGFFYIGMITRNERNAIIQHGTMTLVKKNVLEEVGGWAEWCITEDAELGLRIFENGYEAMYIPKSCGKGLIPDTFIDFKKQRFRWAYGAIQILRHHARKIFGREKNALTRGQKYHFFAGWLPWIADSANLIFNFAALLWTLAMLLAPRKIDPPMAEFAMLPIVLFMFKIVKLVYIYRTRIGEGVLNTISAAIAGTALSHTIAVAVLQGFTTKGKPFFRTPKRAASFAVLHALSTAREELFFMMALLLSAFALTVKIGIQTFDMHVWIIVLTIQSVPYAAAVMMSFISGLPIKIDAEKRANSI